jgi:hypothetical protein
VGHSKDGGITVKAMRTSMSEVQLIPEFPLVVDASYGKRGIDLLRSCLSFFRGLKTRVLFELISDADHKAKIGDVAAGDEGNTAEIDEQVRARERASERASERAQRM